MPEGQPTAERVKEAVHPFRLDVNIEPAEQASWGLVGQTTGDQVRLGPLSSKDLGNGMVRMMSIHPNFEKRTPGGFYVRSCRAPGAPTGMGLDVDLGHDLAVTLGRGYGMNVPSKPVVGCRLPLRAAEEGSLSCDRGASRPSRAHAWIETKAGAYLLPLRA